MAQFREADMRADAAERKVGELQREIDQLELSNVLRVCWVCLAAVWLMVCVLGLLLFA